MPDLDTHIWQRLRDRGLLVYGLHGDEQPQALANFVEQTGITFPVIHSQYTIIDFDFSTVGYPFPRQVVIDKNRTIRAIRNDLNVVELDAQLSALLDE